MAGAEAEKIVPAVIVGLADGEYGLRQNRVRVWHVLARYGLRRLAAAATCTTRV
jgi:hypothetical protein